MIKKLLITIIVLFAFIGTVYADSALQVDFLLSGYRTPASDVVLSGGKVYTYLDGTSTLSTLWTDKDKGGNAANPIILDSSGKAEIFGDNIYKFMIYDSDDVLIETLNGLTYKPISTQSLSLFGCDLPTALTTIGSVNQSELRIDCDCIIAEGTTVTITDNISLDVINGGSFDGIAAGGTETLIINGPQLSAGRYKIFGINLTVTGLKTTFPEWWGGLPDDSTDCLFSFDSANDSIDSGGVILCDAGTYILSDTFEMSDGIKLKGLSSRATEIKAQAGATITGGLITNETKTPIGQEYFYIEDLRFDGNKGNGSTVDSLIYLENVYINSHLKNLVLNNNSGHCLWIVRSVGFGPLYVENTWFSTSDDDLLYIQGGEGLVFFNCSFENVAANKNCIHLTGDSGGSRSQVLFTMPHFEFSNAGVIGVYADKTSVSLIMPEFQGSQLADQYNVYIQNDGALEAVDYYISNPQQSATVRHGIYIKDINQEFTENYGETGILTNAIPRFTSGFEKILLGDFPAGGYREFTDGDTTPSIGGSTGSSVWRTANTAATTITAFDDIEDGQFFMVYFGDSNTTIDFNNTKLRISGKEFNAGQEDIILFLAKGDISWEISRSKNVDTPLLVDGNSATPTIDGVGALTMSNAGATNVTRFLRLSPPETPLMMHFTNSNTTLVDGTYIKLAGGINYNPPADTVMIFMPGGTVLYELSRTTY